MTVRLSPHKATGIMRDYFHGVGQSAIARKYCVDQSTVSIYASRFKQLADKKDILQVGKEFGVLNEVDSLRSISVEMAKYQLTVEDALEGIGIIRLFRKTGVPPDKHTELIRLCQKVDDPAFIEASLELIKVEREAGMSYQEIVKQCRDFSQKLESTRSELNKVHTKLNSTSNLLNTTKKEVNREEAKLTGVRRDLESEQKAYQDKLAKFMGQLKVKEQELAEFADLKTRLAKSGITIPDLIKLAEEFKK